MNKRSELRSKGMDIDTIDKMGFKNYTYDEFIKAYKKKNPPTEKEIKAKQEYQKKRLEGLRLAKDIQAYNNQGKVANVSGFDMPRKPSILSIETDMLNQTMLLFSPEWQKVQGAARISDAELLMEIGI